MFFVFLWHPRAITRMGASTPTVVRKYTESWWDYPNRCDSEYHYSDLLGPAYQQIYGIGSATKHGHNISANVIEFPFSFKSGTKPLAVL